MLVIRNKFFLYLLCKCIALDLKTNDFTIQARSAMAGNPVDTGVSGHLMLSVSYSGINRNYQEDNVCQLSYK